jgi:hypothetical protein
MPALRTLAFAQRSRFGFLRVGVFRAHAPGGASQRGRHAPAIAFHGRR